MYTIKSEDFDPYRQNAADLRSFFFFFLSLRHQKRTCMLLLFLFPSLVVITTCIKACGVAQGVFALNVRKVSHHSRE